MSLSKKAQRALDLASRSKVLGAEIAAAIDAMGSGPADNVSLFGATSDTSLASPDAAALAVDSPTASSLMDNMAATIDAALDLKADQEDVEALASDMNDALDLKADQDKVEAMRSEIEDRLDAIEAKMDLLIQNLIDADIVSDS